MNSKRIMVWVIAAILVFPTPLLFAYGGSGGGGSEGGGGGGESIGGETRGDTSRPPTSFVPVDTVFVTDPADVNTSPAEATPVVVYVPLPEVPTEIGIDDEDMIKVLVIGGSICVGVATGGSSPWVQITAAGAYGGTSTYITNKIPGTEEPSSETRATLTSMGVAMVPAGPVAQETISQFIGLIPAPDISNIISKMRETAQGFADSVDHYTGVLLDATSISDDGLGEDYGDQMAKP